VNDIQALIDAIGRAGVDFTMIERVQRNGYIVTRQISITQPVPTRMEFRDNKDLGWYEWIERERDRRGLEGGWK